MTFYILDPNLTESGAHHYDWDIAIADVARRRGEDVVIFAHKSCRASKDAAISIVPWFTHTCYEKRSDAPYIGKFEDFRFFNDVLADELAALSHQRFSALDCILVPTLTEMHLLGYVSWMKTFNPLMAPLFVIHLMFPSGLSLSHNERPQIVDQQQALFYGLAFQKAAEPGPAIQFYGGGRQIAREFTELSGLEIDSHPIPWRPTKRLTNRLPERPSVLLYAGDAKAEKGFGLVPEIVETLAEAYSNWVFLIHANEATAWDETRKAFDRLTKTAGKFENVQLKTGRLSRADYDQLVRRADCMVSTYDPQHYARKSSGVLWEAISLGLPILAPADTWISKEAEEWGGGLASYQPYTATALCDEFSKFAANLESLMKRSNSAAVLFQARNGPEAVFNQFANLWAARWVAAKLVGQPSLRKLTLDEQGGDGLYAAEVLDGAKVRWTGREFEIKFDWEFSGYWELILTAPNFIGAEQILKARAQGSDGEPLSAASEIQNETGTIVVTGSSSAADENGMVKIRIVLPWTYRPEGEVRDLGILLREISVGPSHKDLSSSDGNRGIRILTPATPLDDGNIKLTGVISGSVALDPAEDAQFSVSLEADVDIAALRSTELYVNGICVPLCIVGVGQNLWRASASISRNIVIRGGYSTQWDVVNAFAENILLSEMTFAQPTSTFRQDVTHFAANPAALEVSAPTGTVIIGSVVLDNHIPGPGDYSHIGLSVFNITNGSESWDHIKFNFCCYKGAHYIEFRNKPDWPKLFRVWPGERSDQFGHYVKIPDPEAQGALPSVVDVRDKATIRMLLENFAVIIDSCRDPKLAESELGVWTKEAANISRRLLQNGLYSDLSEPLDIQSKSTGTGEPRALASV